MFALKLICSFRSNENNLVANSFANLFIYQYHIKREKSIQKKLNIKEMGRLKMTKSGWVRLGESVCPRFF